MKTLMYTLKSALNIFGGAFIGLMIASLLLMLFPWMYLHMPTAEMFVGLSALTGGFVGLIISLKGAFK